MNSLNPLAIAAILTAITCFILAFLISIYKKTQFHQIWLLFNLSIAGWALFVFLATISTDPTRAYLLWRIAHAIGIYVSIFFFHAVCIFCNLNYRKLIVASYGYGVVWPAVLFINNGNLLHKYPGTKFLFNSIFYLQVHKLNFLVLLSLWIFLAIFGTFHLYKFSEQNRNKSGHQAKSWMILTIFGYIGGCSTFLPMLGINIYPLMLFLLPIYALTITYAVSKYQFFDVRIALEKSIVYSILIATVSIAYLAIVVTLEKILQNFLGYKSMPISLSAAFIIGIIVIPLRNRIQFLLDRSLFKGTQPEIAAENELLRKEVTQSEKHKAVAALASGIAHEVRNPLTALKTFYEHFPQKKNDPEFLEKFQQITGKEIGRIEGLIQQLLDFAKPSPPSFQDTDIHRLIDDTLSLLSNQLQAHHIQVIKHFGSRVQGQGSSIEYRESSIQHLKVDKNQIKQALLNIFLNAIDAMSTGGKLTVASLVSRRSSLETFVITIADTGCGIAQEDLKHIFEPFFSRKSSGTGLGLAITQGIIQEHKGRIKVNSEVGKGTEFVIELPIAT